MPEMKTDVAVIGGGIAGATTALALAELGYSVTLLERHPNIGGHAANWACMATDTCAKCSACLVEDTMKHLAKHPNINIYTKAEIKSVEGGKGDYKIAVEPVTIPYKEKPMRSWWPLTEPTQITAKATVLATGFKPFDPQYAPMYGYNQFPEVKTTIDIDDYLREDNLDAFLPEGIENPKIAFIQCIGSRDKQVGREYCSQYCCKTSIRLVNRMLAIRPDLDVTIYYIDLQIMGKEFRQFYNQIHDRVTFRQGVPAEVFPAQTNGMLRLTGINEETGLSQDDEYHRVVLTLGLSANPDNEKLAKLFGVERDEFGFLGAENGSEQKGVFIVGASGGPADIQMSRLQAMAAAKRVAQMLGKAPQVQSDIKCKEAGQWNA